MAQKRAYVVLCAGTNCSFSGAAQIKKEFEKGFEKRHLKDEVHIATTCCLRMCAFGPFAVVFDPDEGTFYAHLTPEDVEEIIDEHIVGGRPVSRLAYPYASKEEVEGLVPGAYHTDAQRVGLTVARLNLLKEK